MKSDWHTASPATEQSSHGAKVISTHLVPEDTELLDRFDRSRRKLVAMAALNDDGTLDDETASAMVALAQNAARNYADAAGDDHHHGPLAEPEESEK